MRSLVEVKFTVEINHEQQLEGWRLKDIAIRKCERAYFGFTDEIVVNFVDRSVDIVPDPSNSSLETIPSCPTCDRVLGWGDERENLKVPYLENGDGMAGRCAGCGRPVEKRITVEVEDHVTNPDDMKFVGRSWCGTKTERRNR